MSHLNKKLVGGSHPEKNKNKCFLGLDTFNIISYIEINKRKENMTIDTKITQDLFGYEYDICHECEGTGEKSDSEDTCDECDGTGEITVKIHW